MIILLFNLIRILPEPSNICKEVFCEINNRVSYHVAISIGADPVEKRESSGQSCRTNDVWSQISFPIESAFNTDLIIFI